MKYDSHVQRYKTYKIIRLIEDTYGRKVKKLSFTFHQTDCV